ncbi:MAG: Gfo/Idh/MocA family oxidoreductase [Lentisphaeria bacterium]|jgi:predicted dehydrogenase|nr:Gfo/Idh/MocA family oxidoreductase [Lentisphaeria bacterium]
MSPIRAAIIGYGRNGSTMHAGGVEHNPDMVMAAVCDIDPARREQASQRFGCPVFADYRQMLAEVKPDLAIVVTRSDQHCAMTCDCLAAGTNVLVTKPWAVDAAEAARMVRAARSSRGLLLPWLPVRWACDYLRLGELLAEQAVGKVFLIRRCCTSFGMRNDWQTERKFGGGYILNWGPHIVDPAVLLGRAPVRSVYGQTRKAINPGDAEDLFMAMITLDGGTLLQTEYSVCVPHLPNWFIQGDRGTIIVHGKELTLHRHIPALPDDPTQYAAMRASDATVVKETLAGDIYGDTNLIYRDIAAAVLGQKPYPIRPEDAYELSVTLQAIRDSAAADTVLHPDYSL